MSFKALVGKSAVCAGLLFLCQGVLASTTVYKSVDDDGGVVFTDRPPENGAYEEVEGFANDSADNESPITEDQEPVTEPAAENARQPLESGASATEPEQQTALADMRDTNCKAATERLERYSGAGRLYRADENGEREYLSSKEIDEERATAARLVEEWCS